VAFYVPCLRGAESGSWFQQAPANHSSRPPHHRPLAEGGGVGGHCRGIRPGGGRWARTGAEVTTAASGIESRVGARSPCQWPRGGGFVGPHAATQPLQCFSKRPEAWPPLIPHPLLLASRCTRRGRASLCFSAPQQGRRLPAGTSRAGFGGAATTAEVRPGPRPPLPGRTCPPGRARRGGTGRGAEGRAAAQVAGADAGGGCGSPAVPAIAE
jgi:hypothetical protein